jgi:ketosteroid isomerase-like protein
MNGPGRGVALTLGGLLALLAACTSPVPEAGPVSSPDPVAEVTAFLGEYLAAVDARDADAIGRAYVEDDRFIWIEDGRVRYRSAEEIMASLGALPSGSAIRTELSDVEVVPVGVSGAHAWSTFTTTVGTGPSSFSFGGAISFVLERENGRWRLAGGHTSSSTGR